MDAQRYLVAFGAAGLVFAGVYGAAASLNVDGGNAQAGQNQESLSCDQDGVVVEGYSIEQNLGGIEPLSLGVVVSGISADCEDLFLTARTFDADGNVLGNGVVQIDDTEVTANYTSGQGVEVSKIESVTLAIT